MSDKDSVFDEPSDQDANESTFDQLVGEGKKFKTKEDLAKSKAFTDKHVETLESELKDLRLQLEKASTVEDVMEALKESRKEPKVSPEVKSMSEEDILTLIKKNESAKQVDANVKEADRLFKEKFGDQAEHVFAQKAKELGVSGDYFKKIAADSPALFMSIFTGPTQQGNTGSTPSKPSNVSLPSNDNQDELTVQALLEKRKAEGKSGLTHEDYQALFEAEEKRLGVG